MYFAAQWCVKLRLAVVMAGLVVIATGRCGWAGDVRPSAEPRFGVEGERHRMVLPLSAVPAEAPSLTSGGATIHVRLPEMKISAARTHAPPLLSASAEKIRDLVVRAGELSINTKGNVEQAKAFLLRGPPRLVVDMHIGSAAFSNVVAGMHGKPSEDGLQLTGETQEKPISAIAGRAQEESLGEESVVATASAPVRTEEETVATVISHPAGTFVAANPSLSDRRDAGTSAPGEADRLTYCLEELDGRPVIWPDLDARYYRPEGIDEIAAEFLVPRREAVIHVRMAWSSRGEGETRALDEQEAGHEISSGALPGNAPAAAHFLDADLEYLSAGARDEHLLSAIELYRRAVRIGSSFPDRERGRLMIGFAQLAMGFGAEAASTFQELSRRASTPSVASLAYLGAGRGSRLARDNRMAERFFRAAIASGGRNDGACRARVDLSVILAESGRGRQALPLLEQAQLMCPAYIVRAPRALLVHVGVLAAAGQVEKAEKVLLALPEFEGELFMRRKFLEGEIAIALGAPEFARRAYEAIRAYEGVPEDTEVEATLRLAELEDEAGRYDVTAALLGEVAAGHHSEAIRARGLATAARLLAGHGRYPEGLHVLERADALGPTGLAAAEAVRSRLFRSWVSGLARQGDDAAILAVFYGYRGDGVGSHLPPDGVVRVASAAATLGLPEVAAQVAFPVRNRVGGSARVEAHRILAQAALARGDNAKVLQVTEDIVRSGERGTDLAAISRIRAAALLRLDRIDEAIGLVDALGTREDLIMLGTEYWRSTGDAENASVILEAALAGTEEAGQTRSVLLSGWLALADAASEAKNHKRTAAALRAAIRLSSDEEVAALQYRLARTESVGAPPGRAAQRYASLAETVDDPLLARAAAAEARYFRALEEAGHAE